MKTIEYRDIVDRTGWDRGPWDNEPDKVQWPDPETGLPCLAVRNAHMGNWCGYVGVGQQHPWYEVNDGDERLDVSVHGDLTFSGLCAESDKEHGICHRPDPGESDRVWWFGFDCCHAFDLAPGMVAAIKKSGARSWPGDVYRDLPYVKNQCADLAKQLESAAEKQSEA